MGDASISVSTVSPYRFPHGHEVLRGDIGLDVVDGVEDKSGVGRWRDAVALLEALVQIDGKSFRSSRSYAAG